MRCEDGCAMDREVLMDDVRSKDNAMLFDRHLMKFYANELGQKTFDTRKGSQIRQRSIIQP